MPKIKVLPEFLMNQIAAGEVVERPASVVKELLENAVDANAKNITIEVAGGGDVFLRITDDGDGMDSEDALLSLERHATSKISKTEDLFQIHTLGFRGEALASIASVAHLILQTKRADDLEGTRIQCEGGKILSVKSVGIPSGTQIEIRELFFNTPARKKYLKNDTTEFQHITDVVVGIALTFPQVGFKLIHNEKVVFDFPPVTDEFTRIRTVLGKNIADELIPVFNGHQKIQLKGYIGKPLIARSNRNLQYLFVNNREVKSHVLSYAVKQSYHSLLPKEKHPVFLLYLQVDPELVDVNVHPRKSEVRFRDEKEIFSILSAASKQSLEKYVLAPHVSSGMPENYYQEMKQAPLMVKETAEITYNVAETFGKKDPNELLESIVSLQKEIQQTGENDVVQQSEIFQLPVFERDQSPQIIPLAQLDASYILCQQGKNLVLIDQHAAHERIRYTELMQQSDQIDSAVQTLITPHHLELSLQEIGLLEENRHILIELGFEIEHFGGNTYVVQAVPNDLTNLDIQNVILGLLERFGKSAKQSASSLKEVTLTYLACRSAVKFGDSLSPMEQTALIEKLMLLDAPYTCPHGRPTMVTLSAEELRRRFGREY